MTHDPDQLARLYFWTLRQRTSLDGSPIKIIRNMILGRDPLNIEQETCIAAGKQCLQSFLF
jgi:hypothetical protein